jgi:7-carboxy-7-deazaguanine synthase
MGFPSHPTVSIETNGACPVDWVLDARKKNSWRIDLVVDYKVPSSGMNEHMIGGNYRDLQPTDTLKFVCRNEDDVLASVSMLRSLLGVHTCRPTVYFHVVGGKPARWLSEFLLGDEHGLTRRFDLRFGVQLHKLIWGSERGR